MKRLACVLALAATSASAQDWNSVDAGGSDTWAAAATWPSGAQLVARCGSGDFETGRSLDLSGTGCALLGIRSIAQSPSETELVSVSDGKFFMGTRSFAPGLSEERPAQLSSYGLVRTP